MKFQHFNLPFLSFFHRFSFPPYCPYCNLTLATKYHESWQPRFTSQDPRSFHFEQFLQGWCTVGFCMPTLSFDDLRVKCLIRTLYTAEGSHLYTSVCCHVSLCLRGHLHMHRFRCRPTLKDPRTFKVYWYKKMSLLLYMYYIYIYYISRIFSDRRPCDPSSKHLPPSCRLTHPVPTTLSPQES